jgi:hypothetical protein
MMQRFDGFDPALTNEEQNVFLTLALVGGEWLASHPDHFITGERAPGTNWIGGWVGPRASLNNMM